MNLSGFQVRVEAVRKKVGLQKSALTDSSLLSAETAEMNVKIARKAQDANKGMTDEEEQEFVEHVGVTLMYLAALATELHFDLAEISEFILTEAERLAVRGEKKAG